MLLLPSTGARHPYKIDERYLKKRNVTIEDMDPYNISVYTLKELIWRDWREGTSGACFFPLYVRKAVWLSEHIMAASFFACFR
jgi:hypothetical protein